MALSIAVVGTAFGAVLGYMLRFREWLREKRLTAYADFVAAFFQVTRDALVVSRRTDSAGDYADFIESWERFYSRRAQVAILATDKTAAAAQNCVAFITEELWPKRSRRGSDELNAAQWKGLALEQAFIGAAARELGPRLLARRRSSGRRRPA